VLFGAENQVNHQNFRCKLKKGLKMHFLCFQLM
jgi:hypothetical protein